MIGITDLCCVKFALRAEIGYNENRLISGRDGNGFSGVMELMRWTNG